MAGEPQLCIPVDPLHAFSGISLVPRIIRASPDAQVPSDPNDLDSLHNFMKSMESSSPERALDEAKVILNRGTELLNSKCVEFLDALSVDKDAVALEGKEQPQQRREGLGRKRARFSLKPETSQTSDNLEPTFNIDQLQDPAQFFSAFEKLENARKEIQIQKGQTAPQSTNYDPSMNRHRRRPSILGKSASYKHRYSSAISEQDDMHMSSPELPGSYDELLQGTNTADPEEEEIDVEVETENNVNEILDELLSKHNEDLDGDGAVSLLQELLQFKPIDVGSLSVPDFHDVGRTNFKALTEKLPKTRKVLSDISNLAKNLTGETPKKLTQGTESPLNSMASPTPPRSPLASLSLLERHSLQSSTQRDLSSPLHVDLSERRNSYSHVDIEEESRQVSALNDPNMPGSVSADMEDDTCRPQVSDFHDVGRTNFKALTEKLPRTRKVLSDISNLAKNLTGETPKNLKQGTESPLNSIASPTPPSSPLASLSLLERHSLQSSPRRDLSSPLHVDLSERRNSYSHVDIEEESRQVSVLNDPNMPGSVSADMEDDTCRPQVSDIDIQRARRATSTHIALDKNIDQQVMDADASPQRSQNDMLERHAGMNLHGKTMACDLSGGNEDDSEKNNPDKLTNVGDELKVSLVEALPNNEDIAKSANSSDMHQYSQLEEIVSKECYPAHQAVKVQESCSMDALDKSQNLTNEVIEVASEGNHVDMLSTIGDINEEQQLQTQNCRTKSSQGTQRKKNNAHPLSPSLAAAGTSFESGVRRSRRIKTRPLEYWKGERLLYGRVNESLKVVGLKYISPAKGGGKLKVKSYVSDEYNGILELAAAH